MWREYVSKRGRTTNQSTKFQNSKAIWLTLLTGSFIKPSCRLLKLFNKNLEKNSQFLDLGKISALSEIQKQDHSCILVPDKAL